MFKLLVVSLAILISINLLIQVNAAIVSDVLKENNTDGLNSLFQIIMVYIISYSQYLVIIAINSIFYQRERKIKEKKMKIKLVWMRKIIMQLIYFHLNL